MRTNRTEQRPSGIPSIPELPWGSHFCVLYASQRELFDALVPFVQAGLERNELCAWEVDAPFTVEEVTNALARAVPDFARYVALGQVEIVSPPVEATRRRGSDDALEAQIDRAILRGFDGVRLVRHGGETRRARGLAGAAGSIGRPNVLAAFAYPRSDLGVVDLMERVQEHPFSLVCNSGRWEVLKGSQARTDHDALQRSQEKLQSLFRNMSEGFAYHRIVLDGHGKPCDYVFLEVNAAFERLTGLSAEQIIGQRVTRVLPDMESDSTDWIGKYGRVALTGEPVQFESHAAALDRWYAVSAFSTHPGYFAVTFADVTDRKRAEAQRRAAEERLLVTLRSIGDAVISTDTTGSVVMLNRVAEELTGFTQAEASGKPLREVFNVVHEETGAPAEDPVRKVVECGTAIGIANHTALVRRDGRRISIADSAAPVRSEGGELLGVVLVFRDVTDERRAERNLAMEKAALRASEARFKLLSDSASLLLSTDDPQGAVSSLCREVMEHLDCEIFLNFLADPAARTLHLNAHGGLTDEQVRGLERLEYGVAVCGCVARDRQPIVAEEIGRSSDQRLDLVRGYGIQAYCCHPLMAEGRLLGTLSFGTKTRARFSSEDVTLMKTVANQVAVAMDRIQSQRALRNAYQRLQDADRHKDEFLAVLSHELRNPLAPIQNSLYILDRASPGCDQARRSLDVIRRQAAHLSRIVDDLLDVTRIARGKIRLQRQRVDVVEIMRRTVEDYRTSFLEGGVRLQARMPDGALWADVDSTRLAQVVGNLLGNALKFTPRDGTVELKLRREQAWAILTVRDSGAGIAPDVIERLFQPFSQAEQTLDRSRGGLGLGLALVRGLAELHGGSASAQSEGLGRGAEFTVRLPLGGVPAQSAEAPTAGPASPRRVLVIDDNVDSANSLRELLELWGHEVKVAYDGAEGIAVAHDFRPELVLCDIGLPGMSGHAVARALRADAALDGAYLVALTGYALPEDVQRAAESGFHRHLAKPPGIEALQELLAARDPDATLRAGVA
jgi:PAS domain S-box-containing protein